MSRAADSLQGSPGTQAPTQVWREKGLVLEAPCLAAFWMLCYWGPWVPARPVTAWLALASWLAAHGHLDLGTSSAYVTGIVTLMALSGAALRVFARRPQADQSWGAAAGLRQSGLFFTCAPLCVLMPAAGAAWFLIAVSAVTAAGWQRRNLSLLATRNPEPFWQGLLRESFPLLAAGCFLLTSWQYNAQWLLRGLLIAAGLALLARAALPVKAAGLL